MAGTANSLMGSVRFGVGAVMGSLVASFKMETAAPMLYTMDGLRGHFSALLLLPDLSK